MLVSQNLTTSTVPAVHQLEERSDFLLHLQLISIPSSFSGYERRCAQQQAEPPAGLIKDMEIKVLVSETMTTSLYVFVHVHTCEFSACVCVIWN